MYADKPHIPLVHQGICGAVKHNITFLYSENHVKMSLIGEGGVQYGTLKTSTFGAKIWNAGCFNNSLLHHILLVFINLNTEVSID